MGGGETRQHGGRVRVQQVLDVIERWAPPALAAEWDKIGLQIGRSEAEVSSILLAVDGTDAVIDEAVAVGAQLIAAHHPLLFHPITALNGRDPSSTRALRLAEERIAYIAAHTNLDAAPEDSTSDALIEHLGLSGRVRPLGTGAAVPAVKLVTFIPAGDVESAFSAMADEGAGRIGEYSACSFRVTGTGTFRGSEGASPAIGEPGRFERVEEVRLETIVPRWRLGRVISALVQVHPYEEVAYDVYPMECGSSGSPFARLVELDVPAPLAHLAQLARERCPSGWFGVTGDPEALIERLAVCAGGGASVIAQAKQVGADALITGEIGHHDALQAIDMGLHVVCLGHHASERPVLSVIARRLAAEFGELVDVRVSAADCDPRAAP